MVAKSLLLLAVSYISATAALGHIELEKGNGNYIIQLNQSTCIKHFVPNFIDGAFKVFSQSLGEHNLEKRNNRIIRRDTDNDQVHVVDAFDLGNAFKAISVKFESLDLIKSIVSSFHSDIVNVIPDYDVQFISEPTSRLGKRYYIRTVDTSKNNNSPSSSHPHHRNSLFDFDKWHHDKDCPFAPKSSKMEPFSFKALSTKKSTTTRKTTKKTTTKKKTSTKKTSTKKTSAKKTSTKKTSAKKTSTKKASAKKISTKKTSTKKTSTKKTSTKKTTTTKKTTVKKLSTTAKKSYKKQSSAQWNLARISEHKRSLAQPYIYDSKAGSDAYVYIIDDGLNIEHKQFEGRAKWGWSAYSDVSRLGNGHGTHVAGIVGSNAYGVAKKTNLIAVQVLDELGIGSISSILAGLQWASDDAKKHKGKAIINMSVGMRKSDASATTMKALNSALSAAVDGGIPIFAAAGNWGVDSCDILPAGNPDVFSVGATDKNDKFASYSCYGKCVDILAPGTDIKSTYIKSTTSAYTMSGTSMATPHVAGVAALLIGDISNPTPANVYKTIKDLATKDVIKSIVKGTPNALLFDGQTLSSK